ncbi:hypothetical protein FW774_00215 (plasmid) [Pedobacter sp. BS3]|uniref:hypothetical protein n=1 Tax=Pedobacter sp. BS3 TaxID=2567937 RepID=UPI0011EFAD17|nr:hypothetical protein [Pedobacter sp. BS3]TZF85542.1 hypothetical protein FW774_00215 [Pedobacter sp. BS3]
MAILNRILFINLAEEAIDHITNDAEANHTKLQPSRKTSWILGEKKLKKSPPPTATTQKLGAS